MKPETRKETYLAAISGQAVDVPAKPITREEAYLDAILKKGGGGGGTSDYAQLDNLPSVNNVTLLGNKTAADLGLQGIIQVTTMPTASATYAGKVVQYLGATDLTYTHGRFYECVENNGVYSWQTTTVQALSDHYKGLAILDIGYAFSLEGARSMYTELKNALSADETAQYRRTLTAGNTMVKVDDFNMRVPLMGSPTDDKYGENLEYLITDVYTDTFGLMASNIIASKTDPETHLSGNYTLYVYFPEQAADVDVLIILRKAKV